jgi:hypothetical protein
VDGEAKGNIVELKGGKIYGHVYGGKSEKGSGAVNNEVRIGGEVEFSKGRVM